MELTILTLNTWGGTLYKPLLEFLKNKSRSVDLFCLQEINSSPSGISNYDGMRADLFEQLSVGLPDFAGFMASATSGIKNNGSVLDVSYGNAIFARKTLRIGQTGYFHVIGEHRIFDPSSPEPLPRVAQHIQIASRDRILTVINFHGIWMKGVGKGDTPERLKQSQKLYNFMVKQPGPVVLTGDFNLDPDTQSLNLLKGSLRDLIDENGIVSTRSSFYPKESKFADYTLLSPSIRVKSFAVLTDEVSDHLPQQMTLEC